MLKEFDVGVPRVDCFAAKHNARFQTFWSVKDNAWNKSWSQQKHGLLWMNPPYEDVDLQRMVDKLRADQAKAIIIVPGWQRSKWWKDVQDIVVRRMQLPFRRGVFLRDGKETMPPPR